MPDTLELPGCLQAQGFGNPVTIDTPWTGSVRPLERAEDILKPYMTADEARIPYWLQPDRHYVGAAWYQRGVVVPASWAGKRVEVFLERCHWVTALWVDGSEIGTRDSLSTPHEYDLGDSLAPGRHTLTLRVDNRMQIDVGENAHSISDNTQSNWNGVVGRMELRAEEPVSITRMEVYPDVKERTVRVMVWTSARIRGDRRLEGTLTLRVRNVEGTITFSGPISSMSFDSRLV